MPQCSRCLKEFPRSDFAKAQLKKSPDQRKCKPCVTLVMESSEHTETSQSARQDDTATTPGSPVKTTEPAGIENKETTEQSTAPATADSNDTDSNAALKATIAKLQADVDKALQANKDQEAAHQQRVKQLETKASQGMQGMERAKQKIAHLSTLANEAVTGLKQVQKQASAEIDSLKTQLATVTTERDQLLKDKEEAKS